MDFWKFIKPDWRKIVLFLILLILTSITPNLGFDIWWTGADMGTNYGFPFSFYGCCGGPPLMYGQPVPTYSHPIALIEDILLWYLISCLIVWVFDKLKMEKKKPEKKKKPKQS
jgi:hypothetical protein